MPIPVRTQSPSKGHRPEATSEANKNVPHNSILPQALDRTAASLTEESSKPPESPTKIAAPRTTNRARPVVSKAITSTLIGHTRSHSNAGARKVPSAIAASVSLASQIPSRNLDGASISKFHTRPLSSSTRPRTQENGSREPPTRAVGTPTGTGTRSSDSSEPVAKIPSLASRAGTTSSDKPPTLRKPKFNTYKQHYSPKKVKEVAAEDSVSRPAFPRPGSAGTFESPTAEVAHLRDELLQLSIVYDRSGITLREYEKSIASRLRTGSEQLQNQQYSLHAQESDRQGKLNAHTVRKWLYEEHQEHSSANAGSNKLFLLGTCVKELCDIASYDGALSTVMDAFDKWRIHATARDLDLAIESDQGECFLAPLDPQWSALVTTIQDKVIACAASLEDLQWPQRPPEGSSIALLIKMHRMLAEQILQEIEICRDVEGLILRQEHDWIQSSITQALSEAESQYTHEAANASTKRAYGTRRQVA